MRPKPSSEVFARWVVEAVDLVEQVMIKPASKWLDRILDRREVDDPAQSRIDRARDMDRHTIRVAVDPAARMIRRHVREPMGCFEVELLEDLDGAHCRGDLTGDTERHLRISAGARWAVCPSACRLLHMGAPELEGWLRVAIRCDRRGTGTFEARHERQGLIELDLGLDQTR